MARQVATAAINALRDNHNVLNNATGLYERSVLMEGSRTNTHFPSNDFTSANVTKTGATIVASATTGPDGVASSASKLVEDTANSQHTIQKASGFTATASTVQSASCFVKAAERTWMQVTTVDGAAAAVASFVNLSTGATGTVNGAHTIRVNTLANGWYRVEVSWNSNVGGGANRAAFGPATGDGVSSYTGDGASGIYVYGYQVEADSPFTTSYIPTTSGTVTRGADSYSVPFTTPPQAMTLYTKFVERGTAQSAAATRVLSIGNGNPLLALETSGTAYRIRHHNGTTAVSGTAAASPVIGDTVELRAAIFADGSVQLGQTINGAAETTTAVSAANAFAAAWGNQVLYLDSVAGAAVGFAAFLVPYKVALGVKTLPEMQALRSN